MAKAVLVFVLVAVCSVSAHSYSQLKHIGTSRIPCRFGFANEFPCAAFLPFSHPQTTRVRRAGIVRFGIVRFGFAWHHRLAY